MDIYGKDVKKSPVNQTKVKNHDLFILFSLSTHFDQTILSMSLFRIVKTLNKRIKN